MPYIEPIDQTQCYDLRALDKQNIALWLQASFDQGLTDCDDGRNTMATQLLEALKSKGVILDQSK